MSPAKAWIAAAGLVAALALATLTQAQPWVYVAGDGVQVMNGATGTVIGRYPVAAVTRGIVLSPATNRRYIIAGQTT